MCFSEEILSAYIDGELDPVRAAEVERHLKSCRECSSRAGYYRTMRELLLGNAGLDEKKLATSSQEVRQRLQVQLRREEKSIGLPFWQRRLVVPMPLAAAVLFLFGLVLAALVVQSADRLPDGAGVLVTQQTGEVSGDAGVSFSMETTGGASTQAETPQLEELIRFLSSKGAAVEVKIELPGSSRFEVIGEPQLIRASDYRREADR